MGGEWDEYSTIVVDGVEHPSPVSNLEAKPVPFTGFRTSITNSGSCVAI